MCTKCHPELSAKFKAEGDWCEEHGYPESVCPVCNPQTPPAGAATGDWCIEHGLPESKCTKCNTALVAKFKEKGDFCAEHGFPESVCPVCNPQKPPPGAEKAAIEARVVRFLSAETEEAAGIETVVAEEAAASPAVSCTARIAFDADRVADIRAIVPGIVRKIGVELGDEVKEGALLFELESTRVGEVQGALIKAQGRLKTAKANVARQRKLHEEEIVAERKVELAEQELEAAKAEVRASSATLRMAGAAKSGATGRYGLTAPIAGTLVRRPALMGVLATESTSLATVADTSVMWALCDVPERDAARVAVGQPMRVTIAGAEDEPANGAITWLSAEVDPRTRTVTARAELPNDAGRLRANQFARAKIETGAPRRAVAVPRDAVQRVGDLQVVFVREKAGVYQPRVVHRYGGGETVQIEGQVKQGDAVVTTGAVLLRTEIMPGSIGAGCCEVEPRGDG
jgi:cobalt-zinc-cadmium efflux system membrane fusion protein